MGKKREGNIGCLLSGAAEIVLAGAGLCLPRKRELLDNYFGNNESETEASKKATLATLYVMYVTGAKCTLATRTNQLHGRPSLM